MGLVGARVEFDLAENPYNGKPARRTFQFWTEATIQTGGCTRMDKRGPAACCCRVATCDLHRTRRLSPLSGVRLLTAPPPPPHHQTTERKSETRQTGTDHGAGDDTGDIQRYGAHAGVEVAGLVVIAIQCIGARNKPAEWNSSA